MENKEPEEKKPDDKLDGHAMDHLVIRYKDTGEEILNTRG